MALSVYKEFNPFAGVRLSHFFPNSSPPFRACFVHLEGKTQRRTFLNFHEVIVLMKEKIQTRSVSDIQFLKKTKENDNI